MLASFEDGGDHVQGLEQSYQELIVTLDLHPTPYDNSKEWNSTNMNELGNEFSPRTFS